MTVVASREERLNARIVESWPLPGVRAGSALLRIGAQLLAIQDDAFAAAWIDPATRKVAPLLLRGAGLELAKLDKPDFEAAFAHDGRIWILGSGSRPNRCGIARIDLDRREAVLLNALPLYGAIARELGVSANIEGAVPLADRLRLFQRGAGRSAKANFTVDVPLDVLAGAPPRILGVVNYDLGVLQGNFLGFTDAVALGRHIAYLAVAEDTPDGIADGAIHGAAVGIIRDDGTRWDVINEPDGSVSKRKYEGMVLDAAGGAWLLTDPDDAKKPAELCRVELKF
ncbi:MAG: DUF6929 family protein [Gammaproteobacteria bacterium]